MVEEENLNNGDFIRIKENNDSQYYLYYSFQFISLDSSASKRLDLSPKDNKEITYLGNYNCTEIFDDTTSQFHQFRQWFWENKVRVFWKNRIKGQDDELVMVAFIESLVLPMNTNDFKDRKEAIKI